MGRKSHTPSTASPAIELIPEVRKILMSRLCRNDLPQTLKHLEDQQSHLSDIIRRCITVGESNSALIIGPNGSGKSMLMKAVLDEISLETKLAENLLQVHLHGLLQTDDRIAIQEITRQLQLENVVGDKVFGSFAENLSFLLEALKQGKTHSKSIIFVLEDFDLFAHHKNQTLLYNLFDICQSAQVPMTVIGLTCRLDVVELLEKRVKSRFSHRQIHVFNSYTFQEYCNVCTAILSLPTNELDRQFTIQWNKHIKEFVHEQTVQDILRKTYELDKSIRKLHSILLLSVCRLSSDHPKLSTTDLLEGSKMSSFDSKSAMLQGVSVLQLFLIIAMNHLIELNEGDPVNFEMVFNEYQKFVNKESHSLQSFDKAVILKAFEQLISLELIRPAEGSTFSGTRSAPKEYRPMTLLVTRAQLIETLNAYPGCPMELKMWARNPIV